MKYKRRANWPVITLLASCGLLSHCFGQVNTPTADHEPDTPSALPTFSGTADLSDKGIPDDPSAGSADDPQKSASGQNTSAGIPLSGNFFQRLGQFYLQDWNGTNVTTPLPPKRGLPAPIDSPPFPFSDWGYGGSSDIGAPDGNTYPLMTALISKVVVRRYTGGSHLASISAPQVRTTSRFPMTFSRTRSS
jgi:hypothetical protein